MEGQFEYLNGHVLIERMNFFFFSEKRLLTGIYVDLKRAWR